MKISIFDASVERLYPTVHYHHPCFAIINRLLPASHTWTFTSLLLSLYMSSLVKVSRAVYYSPRPEGVSTSQNSPHVILVFGWSELMDTVLIKT